MLAEHGAVDHLVNNAGRSIRRSIALSYDRFHDVERSMAINFFGPVRLTMGLLPAMRAQRFGHVVNIVTWGVQMQAPEVQRLHRLQVRARLVEPVGRARDATATTCGSPTCGSRWCGPR